MKIEDITFWWHYSWQEFWFKVTKSRQKVIQKIDIYHIEYITIKEIDYVNIHSVNPLYSIVGKAYGYIEESNGNKYLIFGSTDRNKEVLTTYTELCDRI